MDEIPEPRGPETAPIDDQQPPKFVCLITGATGGLGRELARVFAASGANLLLTGRRVLELDGLAQDLRRDFRADVLTHVCDLADNASVLSLISAIRDQDLVVHTLVNNAGVGHVAEFAASSPNETYAVNVGAPLQLIHEFLPGMVARGEGGILNITSIAGFVPVPYLTAYSSSKAALISISKSLAEELSGSNVRVASASLGPIDTEFLDRSGLRSHRVFGLYPRLSPRLAAVAIHEGFMAGNRSITPGFFPFMAAIGAKVLPHGLLSRLAAKILRNDSRGSFGNASEKRSQQARTL